MAERTDLPLNFVIFKILRIVGQLSGCAYGIIREQHFYVFMNALYKSTYTNTLSVPFKMDIKEKNVYSLELVTSDDSPSGVRTIPNTNMNRFKFNE